MAGFLSQSINKSQYILPKLPSNSSLLLCSAPAHLKGIQEAIFHSNDLVPDLEHAGNSSFYDLDLGEDLLMGKPSLIKGIPFRV